MIYHENCLRSTSLLCPASQLSKFLFLLCLSCILLLSLLRPFYIIFIYEIFLCLLLALPYLSSLTFPQHASLSLSQIHTPKLIGGASEGGSNVFKLNYFDQPACLAQSPQLYKQMACACGGLDRLVRRIHQIYALYFTFCRGVVCNTVRHRNNLRPRIFFFRLIFNSEAFLHLLI